MLGSARHLPGYGKLQGSGDRATNRKQIRSRHLTMTSRIQPIRPPFNGEIFLLIRTWST